MVGLGEGPYYVRDKFRIDLFCENRRLIGRKLVTSTLTEEVAKKVVTVKCNMTRITRMTSSPPDIQHSAPCLISSI